MENKIITIIGSYNVGLIFKSDHLPSLGESVISEEYSEICGGKGSNQAITAFRFGANIRFVARIGDDRYGHNALAMYKKAGISIDTIKIDKHTHTGVGPVFIDKNGNNLISVCPGANYNLCKEDIDSVEHIIKNSFIVGFQLENKLKIVDYAIRKVHGLGVKTLLDPAPAVKLPEDLYTKIDYIKPNETEASLLTNIKVNDQASAQEAGSWFIEKGVGTAIITLGKKGSVVVTNNNTNFFPAPNVNSIDTTGAGDIFCGVLMASLASNKTIEESVIFANHAASLSTTRLGVIEAIPDFKIVVDSLNRV